MMPSVLTEELVIVLRAVALADLSEPSSIARACGHAVPEQLDRLHSAGLILRHTARRHDRTRTMLYSISASGRDQLNDYDRSFAQRTASGAVAAPRTAHLTTVGLYMGAELQPFDGRPGAMDAFALPSRMGRRLHYRDGQVKELAAAEPALCAVVGVDVGADRMTFGPVTMYHGSPDCAGFAHPVGGRTEIEA